MADKLIILKDPLSPNNTFYPVTMASGVRCHDSSSGQDFYLQTLIDTIMNYNGGGGSGGTTVTLPNGYSASTGITLGTSLTTIATVGLTDLKLKLPANDPWGSNYATSDHSHGDITNSGQITASAVSAASGQNLVIVSNNNIKKSNITLGSSTTTFLRNDGQWATPSGGGGGASSLSDLDDVSMSANKYSSQILRFSDASQKWENIPYTIPYGVCSDSSATVKIVSIDGIESLSNGLLIRVKNSGVQSEDGLTLNLNSLGGYKIFYNSNGEWYEVKDEWKQDSTFTIIYEDLGNSDGRWLIIDRDSNTDTNTDTKVTQTARTTNGNFPILVRGASAGTSTTTTTVSFKTTTTLNPNNGNITTPGSVSASAFVTTNGTASKFVKGDGTLGTYVNILTGSSGPTSGQGVDGDIYIKTTT